MVVSEIKESDNFQKIFRKLDESIRIKVKKIILKIIESPETSKSEDFDSVQKSEIMKISDIGKPMSYGRKGTRELYIKPFRLSYFYDHYNKTLCLLDLYHKKKQ